MSNSNPQDKKTPKIKGRLLEYLNEKGISKSDFCEKTGISYSSLKSSGLQSEFGGDALYQILSTFEDLNSEWLIKGDGHMIREEFPEPENKIKLSEVRRRWLNQVVNEITEREGITQKELATRIKNRQGKPISEGTITNMKRGHSLVSKGIIHQICEMYGYSAPSLEYQEGALRKVAESPDLYLSDKKNLPAEWQEYIRNLEERNKELNDSLQVIKRLVSGQTD